MTTDNPAGRPADDFDPGVSQYANEIEGVPEELVDETLDEANEGGEYDEEYEDEEYDDDKYDDDQYDEELDGEYDDGEYDDEEYGDEEYDDEYDDEEYDDEEEQPKKKKKRRRRAKMHCFNCNRQEGFYTANKGRWFYSFF